MSTSHWLTPRRYQQVRRINQTRANDPPVLSDYEGDNDPAESPTNSNREDSDTSIFESIDSISSAVGIAESNTYGMKGLTPSIQGTCLTDEVPQTRLRGDNNQKELQVKSIREVTMSSSTWKRVLETGYHFNKFAEDSWRSLQKLIMVTDQSKVLCHE